MRSSKDRAAALPLLAIVLVIMVIIAIVGTVLLIPWMTTPVYEERSAEVTMAMNEIDLSIDQAIGSVRVLFSSEAQDAVTLTIHGTIRHNIFSPSDPLAISWSQVVRAERLIVNVTVSLNAYSGTYGSDDLATVITIPSQLSALVNATGSTGSIELVAGDGIALRGGHLSDSVGSVLTQLNGCSLSGELSIQTSTGSNTLEWSNVTILERAQVSLSSSTGSVVFEVWQTTALEGDLEISAVSNVGGVNLDLDIEEMNSARIASAANMGDVHIGSMVGFIGETVLDVQSINYPTPDKMDISIETNLGQISMNLEYKA